MHLVSLLLVCLLCKFAQAVRLQVDARATGEDLKEEQQFKIPRVGKTGKKERKGKGECDCVRQLLGECMGKAKKRRGSP